MEKLPKRKVLIVALLLGVAIFATSRPTAFSISEATGIVSRLPERVGPYRGEDILFCQNEQCLQSYLESDLGGATNCASCGSGLSTLSLGERIALPADTVVLKKYYTAPASPGVSLTVVISGKEHRSIHRPQQCLPGQGLTIEGGEVLPVPIPGRQDLDTMLLRIAESRRDDGGRIARREQYFAYWFSGGGRETPYHLQRLAWMMIDRIAHSRVDRWSYITVSTDGTAKLDHQVREIRDFIARVYPLLRAESADR